MKREDYYKWAERAAQWGAEYLSTLEDRPVRAQTRPGEIAAMLPESPPERPEAMETIFADFERIVPGGMTHWQHPRFFAYFPASAAPVSMIAENLTAVMAAQCMLWQTSPAATEIETRMVDWMRQALGLPEGFQGVIQDTATAANLCAVLTMRERALRVARDRFRTGGGATPQDLRLAGDPLVHRQGGQNRRDRPAEPLQSPDRRFRRARPGGARGRGRHRPRGGSSACRGRPLHRRHVDWRIRPAGPGRPGGAGA